MLNSLLKRLPMRLPWIALALALAVTGSVVIGQRALTQMREAFETDARIMHRLLSQRASQHDAILATLSLLQSAPSGDAREQRLSSLYPQILAVAQHIDDGPWTGAPETPPVTQNLAAAEQASRIARRPALASFDPINGRYWLTLAATPVSYALQIDLRTMVPWADWPGGMDATAAAAATGSRVTLEYSDARWVLQPAPLWDSRWRFEFRKHLAADSQPFDVIVERCLSWSELPWLAMTGWSLASILLVAGIASFSRQRRERERAEELLRLGQVARLNTLGELAAGMAHELNQPLTAVLANTQAASRLLNESPPEIETARTAMKNASEQARRAADVLMRLRRTIERPDAQATLQSVDLATLVRAALGLLAPQLDAERVGTQVLAPDPVVVCADPVALEQVIHNLLSNAMHAFRLPGHAREDSRHIQISIEVRDSHGILKVMDNGPGIAPDVLPRIFEPFFTIRTESAGEQQGLGLGLSICESLVMRMNGRISGQNISPRGAEFTVTLPLATTSAPGEPVEL